MRRAASFLGSASLATAIARASNANAVQKLRVQVSQRATSTWIGNSSAQECACDGDGSKVGSLDGACGTNVEDSAPDVFWRADDPGPGRQTAIVANSAANARSTAVLALPAAPSVTYARLYWAGSLRPILPMPR